MNATQQPEAPLRLRDHWHWLVSGFLLLVALWALGPILMPFVVGAILAYVGDPIVDALERHRFSRTLGVVTVFCGITLGLTLMILLIAPMIQEQGITLLHQAPDALRWIQDVALPKIGIHVPDNLRLDANYVRRWLTDHWQEATGAAGIVAKSGLAVLTTVANIALIPVVAFFLLRDWDRMVAWVDQITPPRNRPVTRRLARECDEVLGSFIRGQGLVMLALAIYYAIALTLVGLKLSLVVALVAGLLSFVPYLGFATGFGTAIIAMLVQDPSLWSLALVVIVFTIGQLIEGNVLVPLLVGDKIGLHPVAVIFAVMAGGQLLGFTGVLIALPAAAVLAVGLRELLRRWLESPLYRWGAPAETPALPPAPTTQPNPEP
jgi:predicted PurR-regulated permease PerM